MKKKPTTIENMLRAELDKKVFIIECQQELIRQYQITFAQKGIEFSTEVFRQRPVIHSAKLRTKSA